ncbi:MAG: carboxypeptidase M32 [Anaerolineaceae bacterium]|nr:carboxypeptidase M32 [Anaerolineaceae bacterium]
MNDKMQQLKDRLRVINDLNSAAAVLHWDQATQMPVGGGAARARQLATLSRLAHEHFVDPAIGQLLDALQPEWEEAPPTEDDGALYRYVRREYERAIRVPAEYTERAAAHSTAAFSVWAAARPQDDFAVVQPYLEQSLQLSREYAHYFPGYDHIADPLISRAEEGMTAAEIRAIFAELRRALVPLVQRIQAAAPVDNSCLFGDFPREKQYAFAREICTAFGYDFSRGRLDETHHPFAIRFAHGDVRITTRGRDDHLGDAFFATLHEAGHAMYEQGVAEALDGLPTAHGTSSGVHESQSRGWENLVGRSLAFWEWQYPRLQECFPDLAAIPLAQFYAAINKVEPSLIRVAADEVTYNLHVMLRFDLELALLEGELSIEELPAAWNARYESDLGITPTDYRDGVMQDVHWYGIGIGGLFQGYTLGNLMSAQIHAAATHAHPEIPDEIRRGEYGTLHEWLRANIYTHGAKFTPKELLQRVTGEDLRVAPLVAYLQQKFGAIYGLSG